MRLPEIDYGGSVQGTAQTAALPYEAAAGTAKVISDGLRAYSQELTRTQMQEAAVKVSEGLNQADLAIKSRKYITPDELRATFGDQLPPHVAEKIAVADELKQSFGDSTADQIPMWAVGDALYAHAAKRVTEAAARTIGGIGWQTDFKDRIAQHVVDRQQSMAQHQLGALDTYLQATQLQQVDRLVNSGDYAGAQAALRASTALPPEIRQRASSMVEVARQEAPAHAAEISTDPAFIKAQLERLQTDPAAKAIPEEKRIRLIETLKTRSLTFEGAAIAQQIATDPKTGAFDPAKAIAAVEAMPDTDLTKPVVRHLIQQRVQMVALADQPREGRLEQGIARFTVLDRGSRDYAELSDQGKARIEEKFRAAQRMARAVGSEDRRIQAETDRYLAALFDGSIPLKGEDGKDQVSINIDQSDLFASGSPTLRELLKSKQKKAQIEYGKDAGVSHQAFTERVNAVSQALGYDPKGTAPQFLKYMLDQRQEWVTAHPTAPSMPPEVAQKMIADAILYGDEGGWHLTRNRYAWQKAQAGEPFQAFPEGEMPDKVRAVLGSLHVATPPAAPVPPVTGAVHITNGTDHGWLQPGKPMPAGWRAAK